MNTSRDFLRARGHTIQQSAAKAMARKAQGGGKEER